MSKKVSLTFRISGSHSGAALRALVELPNRDVGGQPQRLFKASLKAI